MAKKIYIGNLPRAFQSRDLENLFQTFGKVVSAAVVTDRLTGESRGFGFVEMDKDEEALAAIKSLNGKDVQGRALRVDESHDKPRADVRLNDRTPPRGRPY